MHILLTKCNRKRCARGNDRPFGCRIQPLTPNVCALDFCAKEMHHRGDELAGLQTIAAIRPHRLFGIFLFWGLFSFCRFDCHIKHLHLDDTLTAAQHSLQSHRQFDPVLMRIQFNFTPNGCSPSGIIHFNSHTKIFYIHITGLKIIFLSIKI